MPTYQIQAPNGNTYRIDGPAGATPEQVQAEVLKHYPDAGGTTPQPTGIDHAVNTLKNVYGSYMEPAASMASNAVLAPLSNIAGLGAMANHALGLSDDDPAAIQAAVRNLAYKPKTQAGQATNALISKIGDNTVGKLSTALANSGAQDARYLGASPDVQQAAANGAGELGNQLPGLLGTKLPEAGASRVAAAAQDAVDAAPRIAQIKQAQQAGYHLPPTEPAASAPLGKTLTNVGGKTQVNDLLAIQNQKVTNTIAKKELGIPDNESLDGAAIAKVKGNANAVYEQIKKADQTQIPQTAPNGVALRGPNGQPLTKPAGPVITDPAYANDVKSIGADRANPDFGTKIDSAVQDLQTELAKPQLSTKGMVDKITSLRQDARTNLNAVDDVAKKNLGRAQQQGADALEAQLDRYLQSTGQPGLLKAYQTARTTLAKAHTIEDAMSAGGAVDASAINKYRNNGGYVSGGLQTIADAADSLKKVVRNTDGIQKPGPFSAFDMVMHGAAAPITAAAGFGLGGHAAASMAAIPAVVTAARAGSRGLLNSPVYQRMIQAQGQTAGPLAQLAAKPASPLLGLLGNPDANEQP